MTALSIVHSTYSKISLKMALEWAETCSWNSDVLLTVHLSIYTLVINQLDAQNFVLH